MKKIFSATVALAVMAIFISSAQAISISSASVQSGVAVVQGRAASNANISWEGGNVATANNRGRFSFSGSVPADCVGTLSDGVDTIDVALANCTPTPEPTGGVFKTGQTTSFAAGDDGDLEKGVASPNPRFTVNVNAAADDGAGGGIGGNGICDGTEICNGTVTDNLTGLTWPRALDCVGGNTTQIWANALAAANALADGSTEGCGLSDGSVAGDWRLPNRNELTSLLDSGTSGPALPAGHPFVNFSVSYYWSSTTSAGNAGNAWVVSFNDGSVNSVLKSLVFNFVTAVRGGS